MLAIRSWSLKRSSFNTVAGRLTFGHARTLAVSLSAFAFFVLVLRAHSLHRAFDEDLSARVAALGAEIAPMLDRPDLEAALLGQAGIATVPMVVRRADGHAVFRAATFPRLSEKWERAARQGAVYRLALQTITDDTGVEQRVANRRVTSPSGQVYIAQLIAHQGNVNAHIRELSTAQGIGILVVLAIATGGSALRTKQVLAPIDEIIRRGSEIRAHDLGKRLDVRADTVELEELVQSLNALLERVEQPVHSAQRFAANVSHELQTPLTAMRFAIESAQGCDRPAERYREITDDVLAELDRMSTLIRDLRLLALAGARQLIVDPEPFDLGDVVQQCCEIARAVADSKQIRIEEDAAAGVTVTGSPLHLRRVILNLTDNAIRYSPARSVVRVRAWCEDGVAHVMVRDRGCGIAPADAPKIFEAFFRADRARARDTGGSGLGLTIAEQIVRAHDGRITVESEPNEGSTFTVSLPAARSRGREM